MILYLTLSTLPPRGPRDSEPWAARDHVWVVASDPRGKPLVDDRGHGCELQVPRAWLRTPGELKAAIKGGSG